MKKRMKMIASLIDNFKAKVKGGDLSPNFYNSGSPF